MNEDRHQEWRFPIEEKQQILAALEARLGSIPESVRRDLNDDGWLEPVANAEAFQRLSDKAGELTAEFEIFDAPDAPAAAINTASKQAKSASAEGKDTRGRRVGQQAAQVVTRRVLDHEFARAEATSHYVARLAVRTSALRRIRSHVLCGVLTEESLDDFLDNVGPRGADAAWFDSQGIAVLDHRSRWCNASGRLLQAYRPGANIRFDWGEKKRLVLTEDDLFPDHATFETLTLPHRTIRVVRSSVLSEVRRCALELAERYGWNEQDATLFVLAGTTPRIDPIVIAEHPITRGDHHRIEIDLRIQPWVSPKSVIGVYTQIQRLMRAQGKWLPPVDYRVFDFVSERVFQASDRHLHELAKKAAELAKQVANEAGDTPGSTSRVTGPTLLAEEEGAHAAIDFKELDINWAELRKEWNSQCRDEADRFSRTQKFKTAYFQAHRLVVLPAGTFMDLSILRSKEKTRRRSRGPKKAKRKKGAR